MPGLNATNLVQITYLSINFGIFFAFILLSVYPLVDFYGYSSLTANLLLFSVPFLQLLGAVFLSFFCFRTARCFLGRWVA